ncbi:MAG: 5'/3'-nucleotidase SurE, partial [Pseudomonadota bacterium]
ALGGARAIALSQFYAKDGPADLFGASKALGLSVVERVLTMPFPPGVFYNVNFPAVTPERVKGVAVCPQGLRADATFEVVDYLGPNGREYQFLRHRTSNASADEGSDARMCLDGWVAITPLRAQLTATDVLEGARAALG